MVRWIGRVLPVLLLGIPLWLTAPGVTAPVVSTGLSASASPAVFISSPRESLPLPVHDEATCTFCQAAAFAPHASSSAGTLPVVWGTEQHSSLSYDNRLTHGGATSQPGSRGPPVLQ
jgi:hypothetical protein